MRDFAFGIVIFPFSWRLGLWCREKKSIFSIGPIRFVAYKRPGQWKPSEALIQRRGNITVACDSTSRVITTPDIYSCSCHRRMGNDYFFLPAGQCLRKDGKCDRAEKAR